MRCLNPSLHLLALHNHHITNQRVSMLRGGKFLTHFHAVCIADFFCKEGAGTFSTREIDEELG